MTQSLRKVENIKDLSSYPGFEMNLNLESLLTLNVENQHAVTHFRKETLTLYEYAQIIGSSVEEGVKRETQWSAHYYTHPNSYYPVEPPATGRLVLVQIPKTVGERLSRNYKVEMRVWIKRYDKCVRQGSVRQDYTMARAGTLPLNLYETQTLLKPFDLQFVLPRAQRAVPEESAERPEGKSDEQPVEVLTCTDQRDEYSSSERETVSLTRIVQMIQVVSIWLCQHGLDRGRKTKTAHQKNERFSSVQVKICVYPNDVSPRS